MYNTIYTINTTKIIHKSSAIGIHNGPKHHIQGIDIIPKPLKTHNTAVINKISILSILFFIFQVLLDHKLFYNLHQEYWYYTL